MEWNQAIRLVSVGGRVDPKPKAGIKPGPHKEGLVLGKVRNGNRLILRIDTRGAGSRTSKQHANASGNLAQSDDRKSGIRGANRFTQ